MQQVTFPKLLILAAATYIAWSGLCCQWFRSFRHSLRRHFHRDESHSSSLPPSPHGFHLRHHQGHDSKTMIDNSTSDYASGIWFSKSIAVVDDISENPPIEFLFDEQHCQDGNNECHYEWGDVVSLKYNLQPTIDDNFATGESHYVEGSFLVNNKLQWTFQCQLCGQECKQLDRFPQDLDISFEMPDCSDDESNSRQGSISFSLSPTKGSIPLVLKGSLQVYSSSQSEPDELLAQIGMNATIAET